jgi:ribosome-binding factor A
MRREFSRCDRLGAQIQRELAVLVREQIRDQRLGMVTIQEVRVTRDLSYAKVYFTLLGNQMEEVEAARHLNEAAGYLRHLLGQRITVRSVPELRFIHDESVERGMRLSSLIEEAVRSDRDKSSG